MCAQVCLVDRTLVNRLDVDDASAVAATRALLLGRDSAGRWHYRFDSLEGRVYQLDVPWSLKSLRRPTEAVRHIVAVGEWIEVEVAIEIEGEAEATGVEWRGAEVRRLLPGGKGRFVACVNGPDGEPDEDFKEVFTAPQKDKEWRKSLSASAKKKKERAERLERERLVRARARVAVECAGVGGVGCVRAWWWWCGWKGERGGGGCVVRGSWCRAWWGRGGALQRATVCPPRLTVAPRLPPAGAREGGAAGGGAGAGGVGGAARGEGEGEG